MPGKRDKLGLLFGSFDPIHNGHLEIVRRALSEAVCNEIWLVVQPFNAYKPGEPGASLDERVVMARLATAALTNAGVYELDPMIMTAHSVAATVRELHRQNNQRQLVLLLGQDLARGLPGWADYDQLLQLCEIYEVERQNSDISSGQVRQTVAKGQDISRFVPKAVAEHIFEHNLYA